MRQMPPPCSWKRAPHSTQVNGTIFMGHTRNDAATALHYPHGDD